MAILDMIRNYQATICLFKKFFFSRHFLRGAVTLPFDFFFRKGKSSSLLNINLLLTSDCNQACKICSYKNDLHRYDKGLDVYTIKKILSNLGKRKIVFFLSGGEPFLNKEIFKIIKVIKERGHYCGVCTNGLLLNKNVIKKLVQLRLDTLVLSVHGCGGSHDEVVGVKKSFRNIIKSLKILNSFEKRPYTTVNYILSKDNVEGIESLTTILEHCKPDCLRINHLNFLTKDEVKNWKTSWKTNLGGEKFGLLQHVCDKDYSELPNKILKIQKKIENKKLCILFKPTLTKNELQSWYTGQGIKRACFLVWRAMFVCPNGDVYPCQYLGIRMGNVKNQNILDLWNDQKYLEIRTLIKKRQFPVCRRCCKL